MDTLFITATRYIIRPFPVNMWQIMQIIETPSGERGETGMYVQIIQIIKIIPGQTCV